MIRFATIGTNFITDGFLSAAAKIEELSYEAVYSRSREKAAEYARIHGAERVSTDLKELAALEEIDAVYIASPNSFHCEQAALMLSHGKHVLCEKTITSNSNELEYLMSLAREKEVVLLEAMRPVFTPGFSAIKNNLSKLGAVRRVTFQYCQYSRRYDKFKQGIVENAFNPALSNGALMDIGVYCVHPMVRLFGLPKRIFALPVILSNGVDGAGTIIAQYDGMQAELIYSKISDGCLSSQIQGEAGCMIINEIQNPHSIKIIYRDGSEETLLNNSGKDDMVYEIREWVRLIHTKQTPQMHNQYSAMAMKIMDEARQQMGIIFPADNIEGLAKRR